MTGKKGALTIIVKIQRSIFPPESNTMLIYDKKHSVEGQLPLTNDHFEIVGENEWEEANLCVPPDALEFEDNESNVVSAYLKTWFDADQKFGTYIHDEPDTWISIYAALNLRENLLAMQCAVLQ